MKRRYTIASPQKENGHTDIANEIMEHLSLFKMSGSEWQILICVMRKTYGWHKKEDSISLTQFCKYTSLSRKGVCIAINKLVNKCILVVNKDTLGNRYKFNKNWEEWVVNKKTPLVNKTRRGSEQTCLKVVNKKTHTNSNTKETIQKKDIVDLSTKETFTFNEALIKLLTSKRVDAQIIGLYWQKKGWTFSNKEQMSKKFKREVRPANELKHYPLADIQKTFDFLDKKFTDQKYHWTLETVLKYINDINKLGESNNPLSKYFK